MAQSTTRAGTTGKPRFACPVATIIAGIGCA